MPSYNPPARGGEYILYVFLVSQADTTQLQNSPTIAAGDFQVSKDGGAWTNLTTLPTVTPAGGEGVKITLSAAEMTADNVAVKWEDASGAQWVSDGVCIQTVAADHQFDDLAVPGDEMDLVDNPNALALASIAVETTDAVWDETLAAHSGVGSTGLALASIAADVWTYVTRTLTSFGTLATTVAAAVWAYATRTLTQSAASIASALEGDEITITRGDELELSFTDLGNITGYLNIWFSVKKYLRDTDSEALIQVDSDNGLLRINGAAPTLAANGTLTVTDAAAGDITVVIDAVETAKLGPGLHLHYDVQWQDASGDIHTLSLGTEQCTIQGDVTRATA